MKLGLGRVDNLSYREILSASTHYELEKGFEYRVCIKKFNCADKGSAVIKVYVDLYTATAIISGVCDSGKEVKEIKGSVRKGSNN